MDKEMMILIDILKNFRKNFYIAIEEQQNILKEIANIPVYYAKNSKTSDLSLNALNVINQKLIYQVSKLNRINNILLRVNDIKELLVCIKYYKVLELDENLIQFLEKEKKLLNLCKRKNSITNTTLKGFEQTCILSNALLLTSINQVGICEGYLENYIKNHNIAAEIENDDGLDQQM